MYVPVLKTASEIIAYPECMLTGSTIFDFYRSNAGKHDAEVKKVVSDTVGYEASEIDVNFILDFRLSMERCIGDPSTSYPDEYYQREIELCDHILKTIK